MKKIKWGVLSTAKIAREKVIPALQKSSRGEILAIASSNTERLMKEAERFAVSRTYSNYSLLLADSDIDAVYIPLPNNMHVEWSLKAIKANKHVLCEKPLAMTSAEAQILADAARANPHLKIMEAFMYRFHPQWLKTRELLDSGILGKIRTVQSFFSYYNVDPKNIRNSKVAGGGAMMDIGCYCLSFARFIYNQEPVKAIATIDFDPGFKTDRFVSGILEFPHGEASFTCSTQLIPYQRVNIIGSEGRLEIEIPVNAPPDQAMRIQLHLKNETKEFVFPPVDQYTLQADAFAEAILNDTAVPIPMEDSINNMKAIEAVLKSLGNWVHIN